MSRDADILRAPNPFAPEDDVAGCPFCRSVDSFVTVCWKCDQRASSGTPTKLYGYIWSCNEHLPRDGDDDIAV